MSSESHIDSHDLTVQENLNLLVNNISTIFQKFGRRQTILICLLTKFGMVEKWPCCNRGETHLGSCYPRHSLNISNDTFEAQETFIPYSISSRMNPR